jgi:4-hydroxy-tetrahydrodipicolinate reductase
VTYRVVHWGTGNAGGLALRGIISNPDLELVGLLAHSADKVGRDAGELVGVAPVGIAATDDLDAILALGADCLCYMGDGLQYPEGSVAAMCSFLAAGTNVVTTSVLALVNPATARPELVDPIEAACRKGGTTFYCNGADPGFASDLVPVTLLSLMDDVEAVRIQEIINYGFYDQVETMRVLFGFGQPLDYEAPLFTSGALTEYWGGVISLIAAKLGVELEEIRETHDLVAMDRDVEIAVGTIAAGTTAAIRFDVQGIVNGRPAIVVEHYTRVDTDAAPEWPRCAGGENGYRILLEGRPQLACEITMADEHGGDGGLIANGMRVVNAIPFVCDTEAGILDTLGIPAVVSRNIRF